MSWSAQSDNDTTLTIRHRKSISERKNKTEYGISPSTLFKVSVLCLALFISIDKTPKSKLPRQLGQTHTHVKTSKLDIK